MIFRLEETLPLPMYELGITGSAIWNVEVFEFRQGETYLVEAESGKGKTSLLSILYGLRKDYSGNIFIDNENIRNISLKGWSELRKNALSYIFQGLALFDDLTAMENIGLKNKITGHKSENQILQMAEQLKVKNFLGKKCGLLSFGQKQRIAIIRALCQPFHFLFADEAFSHIDRKHSETALEMLLDECKSQNAGLIITSLGDKDQIPLDCINLKM